MMEAGGEDKKKQKTPPLLPVKMMAVLSGVEPESRA
jgi:hypothetical protein